MRLDQLRDYLTMPEIALRWKATDPEMCRGVLKGLLRPSVYLNGTYRRAQIDGHGQVELVGQEAETLTGWHYLASIQQVGALDCSAQLVSVLHEAVSGASVWVLDRPLSMRDVMQKAVVMADDILVAEAAMEAETHWQQRSAKTKEFNSVLNILSIVLADAYRYDPRVRSSVAREITEAGEQHGIPVSNGTVTKWLQEASEQFPPTYMHESIRPASPVAEVVR